MTDKPVYILRIDPDGTMTPIEGHDAMQLANAEFDGTPSVVMLHNPVFGGHRLFVGWIHDFGAVKRLPVNRVAWALYGGSPIYGPMFLVDDEQAPLDPHLLYVLMGSDDWIGPEINAAMDDWLYKLSLQDRAPSN